MSIKLTIEHKRKISEALKGHKCPWLIKRNKSLWMRRKVSEAKRGKKRPDVSGKNHWRWGKRGKSKYGSGYIAILVPNHPFCNKYGYVYEHKLILEKKLGRYLKPEEEIHHINKIRDDNRIENLHLFKNKSEHSKFHNPKGIKPDYFFNPNRNKKTGRYY